MPKGTPAINFSNNNNYYTPPRVIRIFGQFDYDPATTRERAEMSNIPNFDTIETDGLIADWNGFKRIWINPPFTKKAEFMRKAQKYYDETGGDVYILIPISYLTTKGFSEIIKGARIYIPNGRIKFENPDNPNAKSPAFGSVIIKLEKEWSVELIKI